MKSSNLKQQSSYRNREIKQVRRTVNQVCLGVVGRAPVRIAQSDENPDNLYVIIRTPDDVLLRNAISEALACYDPLWHEERICFGELTFTCTIGYWRIEMELDAMKAQKAKARPRFSLIPRWLRNIIRFPLTEAIEEMYTAAPVNQMDEAE